MSPEEITQEQLRERQAPIKQRFRDDPATAAITLRADGTLDEGIACSVQTGRALVEAGLHPDTGGDPALACSGDMLLQALVACAGVTMRSVATAIGIEVSGTVHAEGDLDWRGTMVDRSRGPGRVPTHQAAVRARDRRGRRAARDPAASDRALLRRLPDAGLVARARRSRSIGFESAS